MRDLVADGAIGRRTLPVVFGRRAGLAIFVALVGGAYVFAAISVLLRLLPATALLPFITLFFGLCGAIGRFALQLWANGVAYTVLISGKPVFNWQPYIPVTFELGVLLAAISTVVGMLALVTLLSVGGVWWHTHHFFCR